MYTYQVLEDPVICLILKDEVVIDESGPWESVAAATNWASLFVEKCNQGYVPFSE
jgi:hypothetical protein